jgi:hypothetical protein
MERTMKYADQLPAETTDDQDPGAHHVPRGSRGRMMTLCWVPISVLAVALVVTGIASASFLFIAVLCVGMMAMMMWGMNRSGGGKFR